MAANPAARETKWDFEIWVAPLRDLLRSRRSMALRSPASDFLSLFWRGKKQKKKGAGSM
jgi:hypothetical protein